MCRERERERERGVGRERERERCRERCRERERGVERQRESCEGVRSDKQNLQSKNADITPRVRQPVCLDQNKRSYSDI